jgi:Protein of unknown function (DUF3443)
MRLPNGWHTRIALCSLLAATGLALASCGGSSSSSSSSSTPPPSTTANTQTIEVNSGPTGTYTNGVFTDVTICVPGTSTCQTISNVLVDTGSVGLRLLSSAMTISLPAITDSSNNVLQECVGFADGSYVWGPVGAADIQMAGEKGSSVPTQVIDSSNPTTYPVPNACTSGGGPNENTLQSLGANGILGIGVFQQDCGGACTSASTSVPSWYWLCPNSVCSVVTVPLNYQLQNPVWTFPQDNNGLLISLLSVPADGTTSVSGSLIFGIGTQSDNALGSAQVYTTDDVYGEFQSTYNSFAYSGFIDTGSNSLDFLDSVTLGIPDCADYPGLFYCPGSTQSYTVTNTGQNGTTGPVTINIANADALFAANNGANWAFNDLGGDSGTSQSTDYVDFGLPFFFGRNVFVGIENETGPNGVIGPYFAY